MVLRPKPVGKLATPKKNLSTRQNQGIAWSEPRYCMVLGHKLVGKLATLKKNQSIRQNQGIAWSSNPNLWGN